VSSLCFLSRQVICVENNQRVINTLNITNRELLAHPKMVCTPHLGASTSEAQLRVAEEIAEQFVTFFKVLWNFLNY